MPCALVDNADYPDYLKAILKEIELGNDDKLKACACQLRTPINEEGCPIYDENDKLAAFPFCVPKVNISAVGDDTLYPLKLKLHQASKLFWKLESIKGKFYHAGFYRTSGGFYNGSIGGGGSALINIKDFNCDPNSTLSAIVDDEFNSTTPCDVKRYMKRVCSPTSVLFGGTGVDNNGNPVTYTLGSIFIPNDNVSPMVHTKEGDEYYFYPFFRIGGPGYDYNASFSFLSSEVCSCSNCTTEFTHAPTIIKLDGENILAPGASLYVCNSTPCSSVGCFDNTTFADLDLSFITKT